MSPTSVTIIWLDMLSSGVKISKDVATGVFEKRVSDFRKFIKTWTHLRVDSVLCNNVSVILYDFLSSLFLSWYFQNFQFFQIFWIIRKFVFLACFLAVSPILSSSVFRFWNLKPSYKFLNKSNYPLPLFLSELKSNRVCPDFTISTQSTSWIVFYYHSTENTDIPELHKPERSESGDL